MRLSTNVINVFSAKNYEYNDYRKLMFETAKGIQSVSQKEANDKIREIQFSILGLDANPSVRDIKKAIRRHRIDVYEVIEETLNDLLVSGWGDNPFFNEFVEQKYMNLGDTNEFWTPDDVILTVSEVSGAHHDLFRQRLGSGKTFSVKTSWYGIKVYTEYELFATGRVDWATFINKIYEAFDKKINDMLYAAVMAAGDAVPPTDQFVKTGALSAATRDTFMTLVEDVQMATGEEVVIMGTRAALAKLAGMGDTDWVSSEMKQERYTTGRLGYFEGIRLVEIPQAFADGDTSKKLVDNTKLLIMPTGDNKFIKMYDEGDGYFTEITDPATHMDMTMDAEYQRKLGIATIINKKFGVWKITT